MIFISTIISTGSLCCKAVKVEDIHKIQTYKNKNYIMATNKNNSSSVVPISADLSRIVILGISLEVSRFVVRKVLGVLSSAISDIANNKRSYDDVSVDKVICSSTFARCMSRIKRQLLDIYDKRYVYLLSLPVPLVIYGAWNSLVCKRDHKVDTKQNNRILYISSIATSLGLFFWKISTKDDDDNEDSNDNDNKETLPRALPSAVFRPPLLPRNEHQRRTRSDSIRSELSEGSLTATPTVQQKELEQKRYLEILVHNVSHTDLILGLSTVEGLTSREQTSKPYPAEYEDTPRKRNSTSNTTQSGDDDSDEKYIMCRPRFSAFDLFSKRVLSELQNQIESTTPEKDLKIISYPRYERSTKTARYTLVTPRPTEQYMLPVGFNLERPEGINNTAVDVSEMPNLRVRGKDIPKLDPYLLGEAPRRLNLPRQQPSNDDQMKKTQALQETLRINAVFFPLLSTLMPRWLGQISDKFKCDVASVETPNIKKVVVLVSGVGTPRNWTHSISGNSTQKCAELMEMFIHVLYPDITVVRIHSETNIFRYDENITFATLELMPVIDAWRDAHAKSEPYPDEQIAASSAQHDTFNPDWKQFVSVTYSFADGSAARSHAIQAALRPYRPTYFHFWQLKTFWHESKITVEDIEVHSFEEMETEPATAVDQTSDTVTMVVNEMKAFRKDFISTLKDGGRSDLRSFWLRKTKKPVLAVLLVKKTDGQYILYRGTNMEVSMPTGSLCAERNVIGTALASDPGLKREDLIMVAVLSVQMPREILPPPGPPICRSVMPSTSEGGSDFVREVEDKLKKHQQTQGTIRRSTSKSSFASIAEDGPRLQPSKSIENEGWEIDAFRPVDLTATGQEIGLSPLGSPLLTSKVVDSTSGVSLPIPELNLAQPGNISGSSTPKRRIALYQKKSRSGGDTRRQRQSLLVESVEVRINLTRVKAYVSLSN